jgi:hypothetical protein
MDSAQRDGERGTARARHCGSEETSPARKPGATGKEREAGPGRVRLRPFSGAAVWMAWAVERLRAPAACGWRPPPCPCRARGRVGVYVPIVGGGLGEGDGVCVCVGGGGLQPAADSSSTPAHFSSVSTQEAHPTSRCQSPTRSNVASHVRTHTAHQYCKTQGDPLNGFLMAGDATRSCEVNAAPPIQRRTHSMRMPACRASATVLRRRMPESDRAPSLCGRFPLRSFALRSFVGS